MTSQNPTRRRLPMGLLLAGAPLLAAAVVPLVSGVGVAAAAPARAPVVVDDKTPPSPPAPIGRPGAPMLRTKPPVRNLIIPHLAWTASLSASATQLWPTQYTTLTATTNQDLGPTPYWLSIYDSTTRQYVASCGYGTTCTTSVTQPTPTTHSYLSVVSSYPGGAYPAPGQQATSSYQSVTWQSTTISLRASAGTVLPGTSVTLTSTTGADIGPSPFYNEIFDLTTGTRLTACGYGTSCSTTVSQWAASTHAYVAYLSGYSTSVPPASLQATSGTSYVTWTYSGFTVSLTAPSSTFWGGTVTATTNRDVGPTPYYIEIFDENGTRIAVCGSGTTCTVSYTPLAWGVHHLVAFVSSSSTSLPPANVQASSQTVDMYRYIIFNRR